MPNPYLLLVEDNPDDAHLIVRALKQCHVLNDVITLGNGQEALDFLFGTGAYANRDIAEQPQVVLLDLMLPQVHGLEVLRRLRADARTKTLSVVILTSSDSEQDLIVGYEYGASSYIRKPVSFHEFAGAVQRLGLYWMLVNEPPTNSRNRAVSLDEVMENRA